MIFKRIELLRKENNFTQEELAISVGKSREWYGNVMKKKNIMLNDLIEIAKVLKVPVIYFFEKDEKNKILLEKENVGYGNENKFLKEQIKIKDEQIRYLQSLGQEEASNKQTGT